ncbi:MAG: hypothetical protein ACKVPX_07850 [Myxococcaceae bacterium]
MDFLLPHERSGVFRVSRKPTKPAMAFKPMTVLPVGGLAEHDKELGEAGAELFIGGLSILGFCELRGDNKPGARSISALTEGPLS